MPHFITPRDNTNEASWLDGEPGTRPHRLEIDGKEASPREYARVMGAQGGHPSEEEIQADLEQHASRPFRLWR